MKLAMRDENKFFSVHRQRKKFHETENIQFNRMINFYSRQHQYEMIYLREEVLSRLKFIMRET